MALQVWLPLNKNGDLKNQGLADVTVTNNGATYNSSGKIGGCYTGFNTGFMSLNKEAMSTLSGEFTVSCWIKINSYGSNYQTVWSGCSTSSSWKNMIMVLLRNGSESNLIFCISNNSSATEAACSAGTIELGNWMHITCCYKPGHIITYKNGILVLDYSTSIVPNVSTIKSCRIGRDYDSYPNDMNINDFRIYDHCLSEEEIHELSLGKVGHWKLNDREISRSGLTSVTWNLLIQNGNFSNGSTGWPTTSQFKNFVVSNNTLTGDVTALTGAIIGINKQELSVTNGHKYLIKFSVLWTTTYSGTGKLNMTPRFLISGNSSKSSPEVYISANKWTHSVTTYTASTTSSSAILRFFIYNYSDGYHIANSDKLSYRNVLLFDLTQMFGSGNEPTATQFEEMFPLHYYPYDAGTTKNLKTTIPDISGYHNDLTANGNLTLSTDAKRYNKSTYIPNGVTDYLVSPTIRIPGDAITTNIWIKSSNTSATGSYHMPFESETSGYMEMSISSGVALKGGLYINGTRYVQNVFGNVLDGKWHMITITYDGATIKRYVDGILGNSTSVSGTLNATAQKYYFGKYGTNNSYASKEMYISDARLYSTALSADDILKLYKLGNV